MATAVRSIYVRATAEQVRDYLHEPANLVEWWAECEEIRDVTLEDDGFNCKWIETPGGVICRGEMKERLHENGERISLQLRGDIYGEMSWRLQHENGGTRVIFESDYDLPIRALTPYLSPVRLLMFQQDQADEIARKVGERFGAD